MKVIEMKYYEGDRNEILWRWSKWNIMKVIKRKYYEGDQSEILWRWSQSNIMKVTKNSGIVFSIFRNFQIKNLTEKNPV